MVFLTIFLILTFGTKFGSYVWRHNVHQDCQTATKKCRISQATILPSFMPFEKFFTSLWPMWKEKHLILTIVKVMWLSIHSHMLISVQKVSCSKTFRLVPSRYLCVFGTRGKIGIRLRRAGTDGKGRRKNATGRFFFFSLRFNMKITCPSCAWIFFSMEFSLYDYCYGHCPLHEWFWVFPPPPIAFLMVRR